MQSMGLHDFVMIACDRCIYTIYLFSWFFHLFITLPPGHPLPHPHTRTQSVDYKNQVCPLERSCVVKIMQHHGTLDKYIGAHGGPHNLCHRQLFVAVPRQPQCTTPFCFAGSFQCAIRELSNQWVLASPFVAYDASLLRCISDRDYLCQLYFPESLCGAFWMDFVQAIYSFK